MGTRKTKSAKSREMNKFRINQKKNFFIDCWKRRRTKPWSNTKKLQKTIWQQRPKARKLEKRIRTESEVKKIRKTSHGEGKTLVRRIRQSRTRGLPRWRYKRRKLKKRTGRKIRKKRTRRLRMRCQWMTRSRNNQSQNLK